MLLFDLYARQAGSRCGRRRDVAPWDGSQLPSSARGDDGLNYKIAFWATLAALAALVGSAVVVFDRTIEDYLYTSIANGTAGRYVFLNPAWYEDVELLPMSYEKNVRTAADFEEWRRGFIHAALRAPLHSPDTVVSSSSTSHDGYTLNRLLVDGSLIVYEALPDSPNGKAVVVIPGNGHQGARDIMGIPSEYSYAYYHGAIGARLAEAGYVVYAPELLGWGERQVDVGSACAGPGATKTTCSFNVFSTSLAMYGISIGDIHLNETAKTVSYAVSRNDRVAVVGLSNGCNGAVHTALANPAAVGAVVLASCIGRTHEWPMGNTMTGGSQNLYAEPVDTVRALAPLPAYISYGSLELGLNLYEVEHGDIRRMVSEAYDLVGAPDRLEYVVHGGGHEYDFDSVLAFLDGSY